MLTREEFLEHLRSALNHLYDPDPLRRSPLAPLFGVADRFDSPYALQRILTEAIEDLEPSPDTPHPSPARQTYELLFYRYVQQFSQQEVADQLGMSVRHLRRKQHAAVETLGYRIWEQFRLGGQVTEGADAEVNRGDATAPSIGEELTWLKNAPRDSSTDLDQALPAILDLAGPLATRHACRLVVTKPDQLPSVAVHPVALRQALLSLLSVAVSQARGSQVDIIAEPLLWEIQIRVQVTGSFNARDRIPDDVNSLDMARWLTELFQGRLVVSKEAAAFEAMVTLPVLERLPVLVIDDNADTLQLLQRYASGTRYRLIGVRDPARAVELAREFAPQIIVLDVMMPDVDGWEVLGRLRQHPAIGGTPIIVCTILAQKELALALGASAFIRKPVSREAFLAALDHQVAQQELGPR